MTPERDGSENGPNRDGSCRAKLAYLAPEPVKNPRESSVVPTKKFENRSFPSRPVRSDDCGGI